MNGILRLSVYLAATLIVGGLLAFPVHAALAAAGQVEFDSVLRRVVALTALLLLPLYLARAGVGTHEALGFGAPPRLLVRGFLAGFGLGALAVTPVLLTFLLLGVRTVTPPTAVGAVHAVVADVAYALTAAVTIGVFEEAYFRGALLAPLSLPTWLAVPIVSFVYAAVHFVGGPVGASEVGWLSGLSSIGRSSVRLDGFLALFVAGLLLGAMRYRFGHIALGAGFHAGWVWLMKLNQVYGDVDPGSGLLFLAGPYGGTMGYLGLAWLGLLGAAWLVRVRTRKGGT